MPITTSDVLGSDQVGIYLAVCGNVVFHPHELNDEALNRIDEYLGLERHPLSIGGSTLVGALVTGNSKGLAVADIATESDIDVLTSFGDVVVMEGGVNTAGNLLRNNIKYLFTLLELFRCTYCSTCSCKQKTQLL